MAANISNCSFSFILLQVSRLMIWSSSHVQKRRRKVEEDYGGRSRGIKKANTSVDCVSSKESSTTSHQLRNITTDVARVALQPLIDGKTPDPNSKNSQSTEQGWAARLTNDTGCYLAQKPANRPVSRKTITCHHL